MADLGENIMQTLEDIVTNAVLPLETRLAEIQTQQRSMNDTLSDGKKATFPAKKKKNLKEKDDANSDKLDPVTTGDLIYLRYKEAGETGYLVGDRAFKRCGMQSQGKGQALNFEDYIFRVCPMLSYRYANEAEAIQTRQKAFKLKKSSSNGSGSMLTRQLSTSTLDDYSTEAPLEQRVEAEKETNTMTLQRVRDGRDKEVVIFGAICQLQHVKSGLFLSVREDAAPFDPDCRELSLEEGSSASYLRVMPCYKAQTEGSATYFTHSAVLESGKYQGMYIHVSPIVYDKTLDAEEPSLPKCLRTGSTYETNVSAHPSTFTIYKYGRFDENDKDLLKTTNPFRLYHPQAESFVHASCDQQKELRGATREGKLPIHIPYLKAMVDLGSDPDPSNPRNHNAKGVWCFEPLHRNLQTTIPWNSPIRVRHVPSGLYLAVDSHSAIDPIGRSGGEVWYNTYLVEDAIDNSKSEYADESNLAIPQNMIFYLTSADRIFASHIPRSDISIRLEHHLVDEGFKQTLYLSNAELRKPCKLGQNQTSSVIITSYRLVFSNILSVQDTFRLIPVTHHEEQILSYVKSLLIPCNLYVVSISNGEIPISNDFKILVKLLLSIIDLQHQGTTVHDDVDWIKKANSMTPAAFSALFDGSPDHFVQRICRDMKLMDVVFAMGTAPYDRYFPDSPWKRETMKGPMGIQKFVHVILQRMCFEIKENQIYFGKRTSRARGGSGGGKGVLGVRESKWMETILEQLEDPLGSAVTLSKLLSANKDLLKTYATPKLVIRFADLVKSLGPQARLVNFFNSICTVDGEAVMANQEMVLRLTWMRKETRASIYLNVCECPISAITPTLKKFGDIKLPSGDSMSYDEIKNDLFVSKYSFPASYIGKGTFEQEGSFHPVFVYWTGVKSWMKDIDALWYEPKVMNIPEYDTPDGKMVRLEDLCWVLNPPALCEAVTRQPWNHYQKQMELSKSAQERFKNHTQLAGYFVGQLTLHCSMVTGRSSSCMTWLEDTFTYTMLASMCHNVYLPQQVRAAATDFIRGLYLDRYPQLHNCGRPSLPESLWVYTLTQARMVDAEAVPYIKPAKLADSKSLPRFMISKSHPLYGQNNPFHGFPSMSKFFILRHLGNNYLKSFGTGRLVYHNRDENKLAGSICKVIADLLSFGFLSSLEMFKDLLPVLTKFLDGRLDVEFMERDGEQVEFIPFEPAKRRYAMSSDSPSVTALKLSVLNTLMDVADIRSNFRLSKFLYIFKTYNEDYKLSEELKKFHIYFKHDKENQYIGPLTEKLFDEFEALFEKGDGKALQFSELANEDFNTVLLDCLMYDDDKIFASALALIERGFTQRRQVLNAVSDTILLHQASIPVFGQVDVMIADLGYLGFLAKSYPAWGICSRVSGAFIPEMNVQFLKTCDQILEFLETKSKTFEEESEILNLNNNSFTKLNKKNDMFSSTPRSSGFTRPSLTNTFRMSGPSKSQSLTEPRLSSQSGDEDELSRSMSAMNRIARFELDHDHELEQEDSEDDSDHEKLKKKVYGEERKSSESHAEIEMTTVNPLSKIHRHGYRKHKFQHNKKKTEVKHIEKLHQNILRSLNLHATLHQGLCIDYNLVFKGSICSFDQKVQSRKMLVAAQRKIIDVLVDFVKGNEINQKLVFLQSKQELFNHLGNLKLPPKSVLPEGSTNYHNMGIPKYPGMGAEKVIIECMRGNSYICEEVIPRSLFVTFGNLLADCPDPSESIVLDFFDIICRPNGLKGQVIARNQFYALDVLLSSELPQIRKRFEYAFGVVNDDENDQHHHKGEGGGNGSSSSSKHENELLHERRKRLSLASKNTICRYPERLIGLLASCICNNNMQTASMLQFNKMTMDANLTKMEQIMEEARKHPLHTRRNPSFTTSSPLFDEDDDDDDIDRRRSLFEQGKSHLKTKQDYVTVVQSGSYLANMMLVFSYQMDTLVIDPRIYRRSGCWDLVCFGVSQVLYNFNSTIVEIENMIHTEEEEEELKEELKNDLPLVREGIRIALRLMTGARSLGIQDIMIMHDEDLVTGPDSILNATAKLLSSEFCSGESGLRSDAVSLIEMLDSSYHDRQGGDPATSGGSDATGSRLSRADNDLSSNNQAVAASSSNTTDTGFKTFEMNNLFQQDSPPKVEDNEQLEEEALDLSDMKKECSPREMLQYMTEALSNNPHVMLKLQKRRFQFAEVLEAIESSTDPLQNKGDGFEHYGVKITWGELVDRMVRYITAHNFDSDESDIIRIFEVLRSCVLRARCNDRGEEVEFDNGHNPHLPKHDAYSAKQKFLDSRGVTHAVAVAISTHAAGIEGNAADSALELLKELLYSGNVNVQLSIHSYVSDDDKDAKFLGHFKTRMAHSQDIIRERKKKTALAFVPMSELQRDGYTNAIQTFAVLQQLCEGHNTITQNLLRTQPKHRKDINLVGEVLKMFTMLATSGIDLILMEALEVDLLVATMDLLTELLQGPCKGNQEFVTRDESFMHSMETVLQTNFHTRVNKGLRVKVKSTAMVLMAALLEGRSDLLVHKKMVEIFDPKMFELVHGYFSRTLHNTKSESRSRLDDDATANRVDEILVGVVCLKRVVGELSLIPTFDALGPDVLDEQRFSIKDTIAFDHVAVIEVSWKGRIEAVSFPIPPEVDYLSQSTKDKFKSRVSLDTAEKRMKALLQEAPIFISEMSERSHLAHHFYIYKVLSKNIGSIKWCMYALVVLLNLNVVMASYGEKHKDKGYTSAVDALINGNVRNKYVNSLIITWVLGIINACGYVVIVSFLGVTEVPMIIRQTDEHVKSNKAAAYPAYNPGAFTWWGVTLAGNIMFIIMHMANYPAQRNYILYYILVFGINLPWTITCIRRYIVIPNTKHARLFVIVYDTVIQKPFFRNHVLLLGCSFLGFQSTPFFTLMLLDIVNNSQVLKDIIQSIARPLPQLAVVFYTFVITVIIYAQFGVTYFEEWFQYDSLADDGEKHGCHSVVACFWLIFYMGVPIGGMGEVLDNVSNREGNSYLARVAFDLSFFVWVGILLFNVITGLIVDTFSRLREEAGKREDVLINTCFVCGFTRTHYEDLGLTNAPSFDVHKNEIHGMWNYVYFFFYLTRKDPTEYNGVESYVAQLLFEEQSLAWVPARSTLVFQNHQHEETLESDGDVSRSDAGGGNTGGSSDLRATFRKEFGVLGKVIKELIGRVEELETTISGNEHE